MVKHLQEQWLLYRVQSKRDQEAYTELYNLYIDRIYRFALLKLSNVEDAQDVASDTFLRAWDFLVSGEEQVAHFSGFIYQIARNLIVDVYRKRNKSDLPLDGMEETLVIAHEPHKVIDAAATNEQLLALIRTMKQEYQDVLFLRYVDDLPIADIARVLNKRPTAVRVTLHRATQKLKSLSKPTVI